MSILDETVSVPRRTMTLFFLVDTSKSMEGSKIGAVNDAISNVIPILQGISSSTPDAEIKVAALKFSSGCEWLYSEPKSVDDFRWKDVSADGLTSLGEACQELASKLSRNGYMKSASGSYAPAIILLSDGEPTDNFEVGLGKLKANNWFKSAIKIAIAIGDDANKNVLKDFVGNPEAVLTVHNIEALKKIIRIVAVTSSQIGSKSSNVGDTTKQEQAIDEIKAAAEDIKGIDSSGITSEGSDKYDDWD